ncbi:MAG: hypothetical protein M0C28_20370 [Candidatus Moduliflexus flocculans]|nr:hypothetical protein [Candidatus Moduliflexus flocculans]
MRKAKTAALLLVLAGLAVRPAAGASGPSFSLAAPARPTWAFSLAPGPGGQEAPAPPQASAAVMPKRVKRAYLELGVVAVYSTIRYWADYHRWIEDWQYELTCEDQYRRFLTTEAIRFDSNNYRHQLDPRHRRGLLLPDGPDQLPELEGVAARRLRLVPRLRVRLGVARGHLHQRHVPDDLRGHLRRGSLVPAVRSSPPPQVPGPPGPGLHEPGQRDQPVARPEEPGLEGLRRPRAGTASLSRRAGVIHPRPAGRRSARAGSVSRRRSSVLRSTAGRGRSAESCGTSR